MTKSKLLKALESAMTHLNNSLDALDEESRNPLEESVWHVGAELEYALFLFSMLVGDETNRSKWKINPKLKKAELKPTLMEVQNLLKKSKRHVRNMRERTGELSEAYKNASIARDYVLGIQKRFSKERREALKNKKAKKR